jgi:hypothetical protein
MFHDLTGLTIFEGKIYTDLDRAGRKKGGIKREGRSLDFGNVVDDHPLVGSSSTDVHYILEYIRDCEVFFYPSCTYTLLE